MAFEFFSVSSEINEALQLEETDAFNDNFNSLGYETVQLAPNMGMSLLILCMAPFFVLLAKVLTYFFKCCPRV